MRPAFWLAAAAFVVTMLGTTLPTPLYPLYQRDFGITPVLIPVIFAAYAVAVIAGLVIFGRLSDEIGRRRVLFAGLALSGLSAIVFLLAQSIAPLFVGRVLSGLSAGIFTGTATAALVELAPRERRQWAATVAVAANTGGLGLGTLLAGALASYASLPLRRPYAASLVLVIGAFVALLAVPETVEASNAPRKLRLTRMVVPDEIKALFWSAAVAGMCAFAVSGLFSAIVPSFLVRFLHRPEPILSGTVVFVLFAFTAFGQITVARIPKESALAIACATLIVGTIALAAAIAHESLALIFVSAVIEGAGQGLAMGAGLAAINERVRERRGEVSSTYFVLVYIALALPVIGVGLLAAAWTLPAAALVFCAAVTAIVAIVLATLLRRAGN